MANNPYVNKVQLADGTSLIDISDTTATASDVLNSKYFYTASGQKMQGSGVQNGVTQDQDGYIILPSTGGGNPTLITKSITQNGTYDAEDDDADGYSSVTVNVSGGGSVLTKIGTVTKTSSTQGLYLVGGIWKDSQGNYTAQPVLTSGNQTQQFDLYAPTGETEVKIMSVTIYGNYAGMTYYRVSGSASKSTYYMTISGDCTISYAD